MSEIEIQIADQQQAIAVDHERLRTAVSRILDDAGITSAEVSLAIVNDSAIHELNRRFLDHDEPTDVLSFLLARQDERLEGEVIVSADTAVRQAAQFNWEPGDELLLYVVHGTLHLVGYDDADAASQAEMRSRERHYLAGFGLSPRYSAAAKPR